MTQKLLDDLIIDINKYTNKFNDKFIMDFTDTIFSESNFENVDKVINYINEPIST